jgi:hypothetical protein
MKMNKVIMGEIYLTMMMKKEEITLVLKLQEKCLE